MDPGTWTIPRTIPIKYFCNNNNNNKVNKTDATLLPLTPHNTVLYHLCSRGGEHPLLNIEDSGGLRREQTLDQANKRAYSSISYFKTCPLGTF